MSISRIVLAAMIPLALLAGSCAEKSDLPAPGGQCTYDTVTGSALMIVADSVVTFAFTPDDPTAPDRYRLTYIPDSGFVLFVSPDSATRAQWLSEHGFEEGVTYPCYRMEITGGTCTPLTFRFPDQNYYVRRSEEPVFFADEYVRGRDYL